MKREDTTEKEIKKLTVPVTIGSDHIRGSIDAPLTLVEYGDYDQMNTNRYHNLSNMHDVYTKPIQIILGTAPFNPLKIKKRS
jgi:hypothetical protein